MKVDFSNTLQNIDGSDLRHTETQPLTLGIVAALALNVPEPDRSLERGTLALRLFRAGPDTDITPEDAAMIRQCLPKYWAPIIVAQAHAMLEG